MALGGGYYGAAVSSAAAAWKVRPVRPRNYDSIPSTLILTCVCAQGACSQPARRSLPMGAFRVGTVFTSTALCLPLQNYAYDRYLVGRSVSWRARIVRNVPRVQVPADSLCDLNSGGPFMFASGGPVFARSVPSPLAEIVGTIRSSFQELCVISDCMGQSRRHVSLAAVRSNDAPSATLFYASSSRTKEVIK
jgi:hypothetical protein